MTPEVRSEVQQELPRPAALIARRAWAAAVLSSAFEAASRATRVRSAACEPFLEPALRRVPRDPTDAPTVALALASDAAIWTADLDFFGCGVPVWTTETLLLQLELR